MKLEEKISASLKEGRLPCGTAWAIAKESGESVPQVGKTAEKMGVRISDCMLGCFGGEKRKKTPEPAPIIQGLSPRAKVWLADEEGALAFGEGKMKLLELIEAHGSLKSAAEAMGLEYKKAWLHLQEMEKRLGAGVVERHRGGSSGGGSSLTPQARTLLEHYRRYQEDVIAYANARFKLHFGGEG
ncbi:MAG: winged helix-turn-helix domain-containing protein [Campylobacterales bacterium]